MYCGATLRVKRALMMMMPSRMRRASRPVNQAAGRVPSCLRNGRVPKPRKQANDQDPPCLPASVAVTVKSRPRHGAKAGHRKIVEVQHALVVKKRWARGVVKRRMASRQQHRADALHTAVARVRVTGAVTQVVATRAVVQDSATQAWVQVRGGLGPREAHRAAVAATVAIHLPLDQATALAAVVTTATVVALVPATLAVVVATTVAVRVVVVRAAAMVVATKTAAQAQAHHAPAGVIAASHRTDAAVAARVGDMAAVPVAAQAATEIAAAAVVVAASQVTDGPHLRAAALALAAARVTVTA